VVIEGIIAHERVELLYQPLIDTKRGRMVGAEALVRSGVAPNGGALFARASAAALGERLSRVVQRKALRAASVWEGPLRNMAVSINLLPADISRAGYERWFLDEIEAAGIDPKRVTLEITESALLSDHDSVAARLAALRAGGVRIAVDDFGTGYANLGYLTSFPLDMLKIDRGLVAQIGRREHDRIVVKALIRLARELDLQVVVEGVETAEQLQLLKDWGCDVYQGFLASAALTYEELMRFAAAC
jgi:EAL domain-containing protein (putative c-di-GMP-specific phosphodiesterase class I)